MKGNDTAFTYFTALTSPNKFIPFLGEDEESLDVNKDEVKPGKDQAQNNPENAEEQEGTLSHSGTK